MAWSHHGSKTASRMVVGIAVGAAGAVAAWAAACLDVDPVTLPPYRPTVDVYIPPMPDVMIPDGADAAAFDVFDPRGPCQKCLETPDDAGGCASDIAACLTYKQCAAVYACALANGCTYLGTLQDGYQCAFPCFLEAGITSTSTPPGKALEN